MARAAAIKLTRGYVLENILETVLVDTHTLFNQHGDSFWSIELATHLIQIPDSPWPEVLGPIGSPRSDKRAQDKLGKLLGKPFQIYSKSVWRGGVSRKGYSRAQFVDVWRRYGVTGSSEPRPNPAGGGKSARSKNINSLS
jgi:Protein of unknown function (DUF3631)